MALELAIVMPVLILMLLIVVALGRVTHGRQLVDDAAAMGSRAAALAGTPEAAVREARAAVEQTLSQAGLSCRGPHVDVDTSALVPGGQVSVTVRCTSDLSQMALAGLPGHLTLTSTALTPIEKYRDLNTGRAS